MRKRRVHDRFEECGLVVGVRHRSCDLPVPSLSPEFEAPDTDSPIPLQAASRGNHPCLATS
jgi:hypothetical protein